MVVFIVRAFSFYKTSFLRKQSEKRQRAWEGEADIAGRFGTRALSVIKNFVNHGAK